MVTEIYRMKVAPGKVSAARDWASRIWAQSEKAGSSGTGSVLRSVTGDTNEVVVLVQYASLAEFEESFKKLRADSGWVAIARELRESDWIRESTRQFYETFE